MWNTQAVTLNCKIMELWCRDLQYGQDFFNRESLVLIGVFSTL
jgi:hypothetical protein